MSGRGNRVKGGNRPATMEDVARAAGVSRALVSLVMRNSEKVSDQSRQRVVDAAAALGYRPNGMARSLASRTTRTIGVLLNDLHNPFFAEITDGIEQEADKEEFRILLSTGGRRRSREESAVEAMLEFRVDGIILLSPLLSSSLIARIASTTPVVVVSRPIRSAGVDSVVTNEVFGAQLAVDHLLSLGHRLIAHIDGGTDPSGPLRRRGYERAMRAAGHPSLVIPGDFSEAGGAAAAEQILRLPVLPTGIFAANDLAAAGVMECLGEAGLEIPGDISVVGFDNTSLAALRQVGLTTINQPRSEMGRLAFRTLMQRMNDGPGKAVRHVTIPTLVVRQSTGPAPKGQLWPRAQEVP